MPRYIKSFSNDAAIQTAVDSKELGKPYVALNESAGTIDWDSKEPDYLHMPLTLEVLSASTSGYSFEYRSIDKPASIEYRKDGGPWQILPFVSEQRDGQIVVTVNGIYAEPGVYQFRGNNENTLTLHHRHYSGDIIVYNAYGNIMSLYNKDNFATMTAFPTNPVNAVRFGGGLVDASNLILPVMEIPDSAQAGDGPYACMFSGCTQLTAAPELPATVVGKYGYSNMFAGCTSLTVPPELPAMTLGVACYGNMFRNCTALTDSPVLPATSIDPGASVYSYMFYGCTSLTAITCLYVVTSFWTQVADFQLGEMTQGIPATGTFYKSPLATDWESGVGNEWCGGPPSGWTIADYQG